MGLMDRLNNENEDEAKAKNMEKHKISVTNLLNKGFDVYMVADLLGIDVEIVKEIKEML